MNNPYVRKISISVPYVAIDGYKGDGITVTNVRRLAKKYHAFHISAFGRSKIKRLIRMKGHRNQTFSARIVFRSKESYQAFRKELMNDE